MLIFMRRALHLEDFENMHVSYDDYENGHALMVFESSPTEDADGTKKKRGC